MSCFLVEKITIKILTEVIHCAKHKLFKEREEGYGWDNYHANGRHTEIAEKSIQEIATTLATANAYSVLERYSDADNDECMGWVDDCVTFAAPDRSENFPTNKGFVTFHIPKAVREREIHPLDVVNLIGFLQYQSCDWSGWEGSEACDLLKFAREEMIKILTDEHLTKGTWGPTEKMRNLYPKEKLRSAF